MELTCELLGLTKEQLTEMVVEKCANDLLHRQALDEDGEEYEAPAALQKVLQKAITDRIDSAVAAMAEKHVLPNIAAHIENLCIQHTNSWGEKQGESVTFIEYLTQRADAYMRDEVDSDGRTRAESSSSYWNKSSTRVARMVNKHLHYSIETAMKNALATANSSIIKGLEETVKIKLAEIQKQLKVTVDTGR